MFRYIPCIPDLCVMCIIKECWILSNAFSASNEMIICLFLSVIYKVDFIDRFSYVEPSLHLWDEANLIMMDFFDVFLDLICQ